MICLLGNNMKLYDLVTFRNRLVKALDPDPVVQRLLELQTNLDNIKNKVGEISEHNTKYVKDLIDYYGNIIDQVQQPRLDLHQQLAAVNNEITKLTHNLFANAYELEERTGGFDNVRNNRRIYLNEDIEQTIKQRILLYTNWRYPSLEIGCRDGEWTQFLVAADPLYIMDPWPEFLNSTVNKFPEAYQRRLRKYQLKNYDLSVLPRNQFGFVFSWGHFNYISLDTITQFLKDLREVMRPGGVFLFSYNDGDTSAGAGIAESFAQTYMPKSILIPTCQSLGFEIEKEFDFEPYVSWLEIKKPGTLSTVKAHQVMGEIKRIVY